MVANATSLTNYNRGGLRWACKRELERVAGGGRERGGGRGALCCHSLREFENHSNRTKQYESSSDQLLRFIDRLIDVAHFSIELQLINRVEDLLKLRRRFKSQLDQVTTHEDWIRRSLLDLQLPNFPDEPFLCFGTEALFRW